MISEYIACYQKNTIEQKCTSIGNMEKKSLNNVQNTQSIENWLRCMKYKSCHCPVLEWYKYEWTVESFNPIMIGCAKMSSL